jgi:hypothetical protein
LLRRWPRDPRYNAIPLAGAPNVDASIAYAAMRSPISNAVARYQNAERPGRDTMVKANKVFFNPWETIHESNPQEILEREEKVTLPPLLIMQGALDDNVLPEMQEKFAKTYRAASRRCDYRRCETPCTNGSWTGAADRQGARGRQGIHRAPAESLIGDAVAANGGLGGRHCLGLPQHGCRQIGLVMKQRAQRELERSRQPRRHDDADARPSLGDLTSQIRSVLRAGHAHVGEKHPNVGFCLEKPQRLVGIAGFEHLVSSIREHVGRAHALKHVVVDDHNQGVRGQIVHRRQRALTTIVPNLVIRPRTS